MENPFNERLRILEDHRDLLASELRWQHIMGPIALATIAVATVTLTIVEPKAAIAVGSLSGLGAIVGFSKKRRL